MNGIGVGVGSISVNVQVFDNLSVSLTACRREQKRLYVLVHDRLPGSLSTKRLRKKRVSRVRDWNRKLLALSRRDD